MGGTLDLFVSHQNSLLPWVCVPRFSVGETGSARLNAFPQIPGQVRAGAGVPPRGRTEKTGTVLRVLCCECVLRSPEAAVMGHALVEHTWAVSAHLSERRRLWRLPALTLLLPAYGGAGQQCAEIWGIPPIFDPGAPFNSGPPSFCPDHSYSSGLPSAEANGA